MGKKSLNELTPAALQGARALLRVDYNVPLDENGAVADDTRIRATLPTLALLRAAGARVIVLAHFGRPDGAPDPACSLRPVAAHLGQLIDAEVAFCPDTVGPAAEAAVAALDPGQVLVLENTRFLPGESMNDSALSGALASMGDLFVNDAFGAAHRAHASTVGVANQIRSTGREAVAGLLMERELRFLGAALAEPERPFVAVIGGAKISGKIDVIEALLPRVDQLLIGGAMANTFFLSLGLEVGGSLVEPDRVAMAAELLEKAGDRITLPVDCIVTDRIAADASARAVDRTDVRGGDLIADIGPATSRLFSQAVLGAGTVLWNGPMGVFELEPFAAGTLSVARAAAEATDRGAVTILGGGDSAAAAEMAGVVDRLTHVSTGGGASLEFLSGAVLPGVQALTDSGEPT